MTMVLWWQLNRKTFCCPSPTGFLSADNIHMAMVQPTGSPRMISIHVHMVNGC